MFNKKEGKFFGFSKMAILSFLITLIICAFMISAIIITREQNQALQTEYFLREKGMRIEESLGHLFFKTEVLTALILYGDGDIVGFDGVAPLILDNPVITKLLLAPDGIVSKVYSADTDLTDMIGRSYFESDVCGNIEALKAVDLGELVIAGPFMSRRNRKILAGRAPVFLDIEREDFWGLVSVAVYFPEALDTAELAWLRAQGYEYELWRINPDTNERQILSTNVRNARPDARYVESLLDFMNAEWYLRLKSTHIWYTDIEIISLILAGLFICFLVLFIGQNNFRLKQARSALDTLAKTDPLTGIYNRRHFIELVQADIEQGRESKEPSYIIFVDADYFKVVNDTYGHLVGDKTLIEIVRRIKESIRSSDIIARYGGEEFILYIPSLAKDIAETVVERIRSAMCEHPFEIADEVFQVSVSLGVAEFDSSIEMTIKNADDALYQAKQEGRNRAVFHTKQSS